MTRSLVLPVIAILTSCALLPAYAAGVHKWVDAKGITHYSDEAPPSATVVVTLIEVSATRSATADAAKFGFPTVGTLLFPSPCCINEPVFIGIEYTAGAPGSTPSVLFDDQVPVPCDNWMIDQNGNWAEWNTFWGPNPPGYPLFWVEGDTQSPNCPILNCDWNPGDKISVSH